jgi:2-isopropylmalate synthase
MLREPHRKYCPMAPIDLPDRRWPGRTISPAPIWLSTDLRDGNQSLFEPMSVERKLRLFKMLCDIGFKEIEVGFPSASQTEFDFLRTLIDRNLIPDDVTIGVLTQAREDLIPRTIDAVVGARRVIVHIYNATSKLFREVVFGLEPEAVIRMAVNAVRQVRTLVEAHPQTEWVLQYSPENFTDTELPFAKQICDAVTVEWAATPTRKVIINLPATVELSAPNILADQVEWMHRNLERRDSIVLSIHPHNDRGSAVAAAELAQLAGADRVEGCLFGNGERTGTVDIVTLALNLYTQGIHPGLDFSNINDVARTVEYCNQLPIHPRHPYVGDLVFTAFSGSHQDGIKKGMAAQSNDGPWRVPYLPIDPKDLGRTYDSIIRINSQSGKGGVAYLLEHDHGLVLPRRLQVEFSGAVQRHTDTSGAEVSSEALWQLFESEYLQVSQPLRVVEHHLDDNGALQIVRLTACVDGHIVELTGEGNGPLDALMQAMDLPIGLQSYEERAIGSGAAARAVAYIELTSPVIGGNRFGVAIHANIITASIMAMFCGFNRVLAAMTDVERERALKNLVPRSENTVHTPRPLRVARR